MKFVYFLAFISFWTKITTGQGSGNIASLTFNCTGNSCSFIFEVPEPLARHADPNQLQQSVNKLAEQISVVSANLSAVNDLSQIYINDLTEWQNNITTMKNDLTSTVENLNSGIEVATTSATNISNLAYSYFQSIRCFSDGVKSSPDCSPDHFILTTVAPIMTTLLTDLPTTKESGSNTRGSTHRFSGPTTLPLTQESSSVTVTKSDQSPRPTNNISSTSQGRSSITTDVTSPDSSSTSTH